MICKLEAAIGLLGQASGTEYSGVAKCNCIVNLVSLLEVHLRDKVLKSTRPDALLDGNFTLTLLLVKAAETDRDRLQLLVDLRNCFVHEGAIPDISDEEMDSLIHMTKSILAT